MTRISQLASTGTPLSLAKLPRFGTARRRASCLPKSHVPGGKFTKLAIILTLQSERRPTAKESRCFKSLFQRQFHRRLFMSNPSHFHAHFQRSTRGAFA